MNTISKKATSQTCRKLYSKTHLSTYITMSPEKATWHRCDPSSIPIILEYYPISEWCTYDPRIEVDGEEYPPEGKGADSWGNEVTYFRCWLLS